MSLFSATRSVLGMNARNLHYIAQFNSAADKRFADNKLFTKQYLGSRDIGIAKLYNIVKDHRGLTEAFFDGLPNEFVLKPNKGFGGGGIIVVTGKSGKSFVSAGGRKITREEMFRRCVEILDGKFSISGVGDWIIVEECLVPHDSFRKLTQVGLPDVRVIVFNGVPCLAMLRVPTYESEGKANMELGAIALGIDMGSGRTTGGAYYQDYITKLPTGGSARGFQVPHWPDILHTCSKIQLLTGIGFLGVDIVITNKGIAVLELNARSGLKIQIANKAGLKGRLEKVKDLTVRTPEEGVQIAQTLFSVKKAPTPDTLDRALIGPKEHAKLNGSEPRDIIALIDLTAEENTIDLPDFEGKMADITLGGQRLKLRVAKGKVAGGDLKISAKSLGQQFYIDPKKPFLGAPTVTRESDTERLKRFDKTLAEVAEQVKMLSAINPKNIAEQKALFLSHPEFEPQFEYRPMKADPRALVGQLQRLTQVDHPLFGLFDARRNELVAQIEMMAAVNTEAFTDRVKNVFRPITDEMVEQAKLDLEHKRNAPPDESKKLNQKQATERINEYLRAHKLDHWNVKSKADSAVDIQVTKQQSILLRDGSTFSHNRLEALLEHEIGVHAFRNENGRRQPWRLFERGTAGYLYTEEGLAIWNQSRTGLPLGPEKMCGAALHILTIHKAQTCGFLETYQWLMRDLKLSSERAWHHTLKAKRGMTNAQAPGAFLKDSVYFIGLREVEKYLAEGGDLRSLFAGKIKISDVAAVVEMDGYVPAKWFPKEG